MSVPLDRLYNHIDSLCDHDIIIYRFFPHGSKKLQDLQMLWQCQWFDFVTRIPLICHDQEPLKFDLYTPDDIVQTVSNYGYPQVMQDIAKASHLRGVTASLLNVYDATLLLHSEQNSTQLDLYEQNGYVGVYWWSHAVIARDWFRYAEHDVALNSKNLQKDFLVYNRAWSGTREYRLKFAELLIYTDLVDSCNIKFSPHDGQQHYKDHQFDNQSFKVSCDIEQFIPLNNHCANSSADYSTVDYQTCAIEIVLETLFDDSRWHLTEKALRPLACGQPFILAATPGSLRYLQSYGFETFAPFIDETYDCIQNPLDRLKAIVKEMKRIHSLEPNAKKVLYQKLNAIATRNKQRFFSSEWQQQVFDELASNLNQKAHYLDQQYLQASAWKKANPDLSKRLIGTIPASQSEIARFLNWLKVKGV